MRHIPIIARKDGRLVGYIGWKDLMNVRARQRAQDRSALCFIACANGTTTLLYRHLAIHQNKYESGSKKTFYDSRSQRDRSNRRLGGRSSSLSAFAFAELNRTTEGILFVNC